MSVFREALKNSNLSIESKKFRPPGKDDASFIPIEPKIDLGTRILPPQPKAISCTQTYGNHSVQKAAQEVVPLLKRAQVFTLSAIRILDHRGCVIATTRSEMGMSLKRLPEVRAALKGRYRAVTRERISDEPTPPLIDLIDHGGVIYRLE